MKVLTVPQSGSVAGQTASRNRFGQYIRTRAIPVNPNTAFQNEVRSNFGASSQAWRGLSDEERAAWNAYAATTPMQDSLGQTVYPTGIQSFVSVNQTLRLLGLTPVTTPPAPPVFTPGDIGAIASGAGVIEITTTAAISANEWLVFCSLPRSQGITFNNDYRFIGVLPAGAAGDLSLTTMIVDKFGSLEDGMKFFVRFKQQIGGVLDVPIDRVVTYVAV